MVDNTIQLPQEIYEAVRRRAAAQRKTPDTLVIEWVSSHLEVDKQAAGGDLSAFEQEVAAFEAMKPALLTQYHGQYVAIHQGKVVASGDNKLEVSHRVREQYGAVTYYVEMVVEETPRAVRIPSARIVRT
ncbi:MAG: hypothetical protein IPH82_24770 [Chloroflexi bacterium]|jgi:Tfp pilus assembly protein PilP|nr:hypothetical protein [Chloroflexota bacterium]MBK7916768.1 hypothetical protein [Chloroflexota bacterium]